MNRDSLVRAGVHYDEGVERFGGNAAVYEKYLAKFFVGGYMEKIERQLASGDIAGAFRTTHDLKGVSGNLSMDRFYRAVCALTEKLRPQASDADYEEELAQVKLWYDRAQSAITEAE